MMLSRDPNDSILNLGMSCLTNFCGALKTITLLLREMTETDQVLDVCPDPLLILEY